MKKRILALILALSLLLPACGGGAKATTMHLRRTEGRVNVSDDAGKDVEPRDDLGLYSGYGVDTRSESYAWIDLDEVKLTKLDEDSEIEITKDGKDLEIEVLSGSLFFNVTEPLAEDETMTIRSSTMAVGIRGTCGWVSLSDDEDTMSVYLLEGKVRCEADGEKETVRAGEMAVMTEDGEITVEKFTAQDIPDFVIEEIEDDDDLLEEILDASGIDVLNPEEAGGSETEPEPELEPEPEPEQPKRRLLSTEGYYGNWTSYTKYSYDDQGRQIESRQYSYNPGTVEGGYDSYTTYDYDAQGNLIRENTYEADGTLLYQRTTTETETEQIRQTTYPDGSTYTSTFVLQRDEQGRIIQRDSYYLGDLDSYDRYIYDPEWGDLIEEFSYEAYGNTEIGHFTYTYG